MMSVYGHIRLAAYRQLQRAVAAREWPAAGAQLNAIRRRVALNVALGTAVFVLAVLGRAL